MPSEILAENIAFDENGLYIPQTWLDGVGEGNYTPISADRMNHIEQGIKGLSDAWDSQSLYTKDGWLIIPLGDGYAQLSKTDTYTPNLEEEARNTLLPYKVVIDSQCSVNVNVNQDGIAHSTVRYTRLDPDKVQYWVFGSIGREVKGYISVIAKLA